MQVHVIVLFEVHTQLVFIKPSFFVDIFLNLVVHESITYQVLYSILQRTLKRFKAIKDS